MNPSTTTSSSASETTPSGETATRQRRAGSDDLRDRLLEAALAEFAEHGFEGASTRAIASRAGAHQPQINYHFESKEALWRAAIEDLMAAFDEAFTGSATDDPRETFAETIRRLVRFAATRPELHRIMIQEGTHDTERLRWIADTYIARRHDLLVEMWERAVAEGGTAPVSPTLIHYLVLGAATLLFANAPEARIILGVDPTDPALVDEHADTLVALLLPGT